MEETYNNALKVLYSLQSNHDYIKTCKNISDKKINKLKITENFLIRTGITLEELKNLSIIHVGGTKGKGSVCAFTESILRTYGLKTGFFSSPHLISVRERIKINGINISEEKFTYYFWKIFKKLKNTKKFYSDMPSYFQFLTVLMFNVFLNENIDVAIIEVGIGGELDCTNIIKNPVCVGITSLSLEHTSLLGNTIEEITYQKSGIFKPCTMAFSVPHDDNIINILKERSYEKKCYLKIVDDFENYGINNIINSMELEKKIFYFIKKSNNILLYNVSLAIELSTYWLIQKKLSVNKNYIAKGIINCNWPGRMQIFKYKNFNFFLDGAHTMESIEQCMYWYNNNKCKSKEILIFNTTGTRDSKPFLDYIKKNNYFSKTYFIPNYSGIYAIEDILNSEIKKEDINRCKKNCKIWGNNSEYYENFNDLFKVIEKIEDDCSILVTGSLHLIGTVLSVLERFLTIK